MQNLNREHAGIQCIVLCTHLQTTGRTILVGMQYTHCNEELQEGGEHQCDYTIFDPFLEHIAQRSIQKMFLFHLLT